MYGYGMKQPLPTDGWTYALSNLGERFDMVKIGYTRRTPKARANAVIDTMYHPNVYRRASEAMRTECRNRNPQLWAVPSDTPYELEKKVHKILKTHLMPKEILLTNCRRKPIKYRYVCYSSELFIIDILTAVAILRDVSGFQPEKFEL